jgi:hypothetical protein
MQRATASQFVKLRSQGISIGILARLSPMATLIPEPCGTLRVLAANAELKQSLRMNYRAATERRVSDASSELVASCFRNR